MDKKLISVAIPAYNEADNIPELVARLQAVFAQLESRYVFEIVVCENGSTDNSAKVLAMLQEQEPRLKTVSLIRNFNMEGGMMAALANVSGDACVIMSADLQDPPEMIPDLISLWEQGYENVYTVITHRHGESRARRMAAEMFYWVIHRLSDTPVPRNASDFRLVSKAAYEAFNELPERVRLIRTVWAWLGFRSIGIEYERPARRAGKSSFNPFVTAPYAARAILGSTYTPIRIISVTGLMLSSLSFASIFVMALFWIAFGVPFHGFGTIMAVMVLMFGLVFFFLGLVSEYVGMIFEEVRQRPLYIERSRTGFEER